MWKHKETPKYTAYNVSKHGKNSKKDIWDSKINSALFIVILNKGNEISTAGFY